MPRKKKTAIAIDPNEQLLNAIVKGVQDKKGKDLITIDLRNLDSRVCDFFVICHGDSTTQVSAIGGNVEVEVKKQTGEKAWHFEGYQNSEWVLIDYVNIVVHVFLNEMRDFYNLEKLWADGIVTRYEDTPEQPKLKVVRSKTKGDSEELVVEATPIVKKPRTVKAKATL